MPVFTLLGALDYASVLVFALTGALAASRSQLDIVGFIFIACLTAVGGGTLRDAILNREVFWVADAMVLGVASSAAVLVFFTAHLLESRYRALLWFDAAALAVAVPAGVAVALAEGQGWPIVLVMGMITGCMGGLLRDVVCNEVPLVLKQGELYATCALAGAFGGGVGGGFGVPPGLSRVFCGAHGFPLCAGSIHQGWRLPVYRSQPPRRDAPKR